MSPGEAGGVSPVSLMLENSATENSVHNCQPMSSKETKMQKIRSDRYWQCVIRKPKDKAYSLQAN